MYSLKILFFALITGIGLDVQSQVQISFNSSVVASGSTNQFNVIYYDSTEQFTIDIMNISGVTKEYSVTRKRLVNPTSWTNVKTSWESNSDPFGSGYCYPGNSNILWTTLHDVTTEVNDFVRLTEVYEVNDDQCAHYRYYIESNQNGVEDSVDVEGCKLVGIDDITLNDVLFYPNPSSDIVHFESSEIIQSIQWVDLMGNIVSSHAINSTTAILPIQHMSSGIYFAVVTRNSGVLTHRICINP